MQEMLKRERNKEVELWSLENTMRGVFAGNKFEPVRDMVKSVRPRVERAVGMEGTLLSQLRDQLAAQRDEMRETRNRMEILEAMTVSG